MKLLGIDIEIGNNISIGSLVSVRTTDGGTIVLKDGVSLDDSVDLLSLGRILTLVLAVMWLQPILFRLVSIV